MGNYDGSVRFSTKIDVEGFNKGIKQISENMKSLSLVMKAAGAAIFAAFTNVATKALNGSIEAAEELENAMSGLKSVMDGQGKSFKNAQKFINDYTKDGLIPANNAITAYKNLALRGYNTEQIQKVMEALKDSATYGRQSSYSLGQAVQSAAEGLKNENSILVDNAGVTKNVAKMWQDYAKSVGKTTTQLTQQEKIQAEVNGILEESKYQTGDAANYASSYSGQMARLRQQLLTFRQTMGSAFMTLGQAILPTINKIVESLIKMAKVFANVVKIIFGKSIQPATSFTKATTNAGGAVTDLGNATQKAGKQAKEALAPFDDLNVLQEDLASSAEDAAGGIAGGIGADDFGIEDTSAFEEFDAEIDRLTKKVLDFFGITADKSGKVTWSFKDMDDKAKILAGTLAFLAGAKVMGLAYNGFKNLVDVLNFVSNGTLGTKLITTLGVPFKNLGAIISGVAEGTFTFGEGIGMVLSGIGNFALSVGAAITPFMVLGTAIWGVKKASKDSFETAVDEIKLFQKVSKETKNKVEPFLETIKNLGVTARGISFKGIVTAEDVDKIKGYTTEIAETIKQEVVDKFATWKEQINMSNLFEDDPEKRQEFLDVLEEGMQQRIDTITMYQGKMNEIYETAANERRALTDEERRTVNSIQHQMANEGITILSDNQQDALLLKAKFNENYGTLTRQQVAEAIEQAKELRDKTVQEANDEYDEKVKLAETLRATVPGFTDEMYDEMIKSAQTARDDQIRAADETYGEITKKAEETYPEVTKWMDLESGKQLNIAGVFIKGVAEKFEKAKEKLEEIWGKVVGFFSGSWESISQGAVNGVNGIIDAINRMIDKVNNFGFTFPDWVPGFGGQYVGGLSIPHIPKLATGAVIPPNAKFMAVLGDQKNGRNLEAPEDLIRKIVREETEAIANRPIYVSAEISGKTLMDIIAEQTEERSRANGTTIGGGSLVY